MVAVAVAAEKGKPAVVAGTAVEKAVAAAVVVVVVVVVVMAEFVAAAVAVVMMAVVETAVEVAAEVVVDFAEQFEGYKVPWGFDADDHNSPWIAVMSREVACLHIAKKRKIKEEKHLKILVYNVAMNIKKGKIYIQRTTINQLPIIA